MNTNTSLVESNGNGCSLVPASMSEAMRLAEMMAAAKLVPRDLQGSAPDCLLVVMQACRWNMDPFAVAQECSVIQGRLAYSGKLTAAVVNTRGRLTGRLTFAYSGDGPNRAVAVTGQLRGEDGVRSVIVRLADVRTSARVWQTQPDQQLAYSGARVWARRHMPEVMLGVWGPDEFDELATPSLPTLRRPPTPAPNPMMQHETQQASAYVPPNDVLPAADGDATIGVQPGASLHRHPPFDPETGEILEHDDTSQVSENPPAVASNDQDDRVWETALRTAAQNGIAALRVQWSVTPYEFQQRLSDVKDGLKTIAEQADLRSRYAPPTNDGASQ